MKATDLANKTIGILGIGREGQAVREHFRSMLPGIRLSLISEAPPDPVFEKQLDQNDQLLIGPLRDARLDRFDLLVRSPGISIYRDSLRQAQVAGVAFTTPSNLWFAEHAQEKTICVTGTKGKSTTSALIAHLLRACGFQVRLAGNIGLPLLSCHDQDVDWWVIELSSFQLADLEARPTVAVILNLSEEHLDWHGSVNAYRRDKLRLAQLAVENPLIANAADPLLTRALTSHSNVHWFHADSEIQPAGTELAESASKRAVIMPPGLPGRHNRANVAAALAVLRAIGADEEVAIHAITSFRSLPHRLQPVGERAGVVYVNDSISSTPLATAAALQALSGKTITLIVGGFDRGLDWTAYMDEFKSGPVAAVIAIPNNGDRIMDIMRQAEFCPVNGVHRAAGLAEAVLLAQQLTPPGGLVLMSPGAPSFPQFRDYRDRGQKFASLCGFELEEWDIA